MLIKSTSNKENVFWPSKDIILIDLAVEAHKEEAQDTLAQMLGILGEEKFDILAEYLICEVAYKLITDGDSPLLSAFNKTLASIQTEIDDLKVSSNQVVADLKKELSQAQNENRVLMGAASSLKDTLARVRKQLKAEDVKPNLVVAHELEKRSSLGTIERTVVELANCIKQTLISIKGA